MSTLRLLFAEIRYRKLHFLLSLIAVAIAVTLFVAAPLLVDGYRATTQAEVGQWQGRVGELEAQVAEMKAGMGRVEAETAAELARLEKETRRLMRDIGFNLMIVHRATNMGDFWSADYLLEDMPQDYLTRLAADSSLTVLQHLVATLEGKVTWEGRKIRLVGYLPETQRPQGGDKTPMGYNIPQGKAYLGYELGGGRKLGQTIRLGDRELRIDRILREQGSKEDAMIAANLEDVQAILKKPGKINVIFALGCRCKGSDLATIRSQVASLLPDTRISEFRSIAVARAEQRALVEAQQQRILGEMRQNLEHREKILVERKQLLADLEAGRQRIQMLVVTLADVITPLVVLAAAVWVGLLAWSNVRQRRTEIGLLRALGKRGGMIAALVLGKAALIGLAGAAIGMLLGAGLARSLGAETLRIEPEWLRMRGDLVLYALFGAPLLSAIASYLPTLVAIAQDPAVALRET